MIAFLVILSAVVFLAGLVMMSLGHPAFGQTMLAGIGLFVLTIVLDLSA